MSQWIETVKGHYGQATETMETDRRVKEQPIQSKGERKKMKSEGAVTIATTKGHARNQHKIVFKWRKRFYSIILLIY